MTLEESYRILGLREAMPEEERHRVYRELRDRLNAKREKAPTPGLESKYEDALKRIDQAIETVESSVDAMELPVFAEDLAVLGGDSGEGELSRPLIDDEGDSAAPGSGFMSWRNAVGGGLVCLVLLAGLWSLNREAIEDERLQAEVEAVKLAEAERMAAEARQAEALIEQELRDELKAKRAPITAVLAEVERKVTLAGEKLRDLEGADRVAKINGDSDASMLAEFRLLRYQSYIEWLRAYWEGIPEKALMEKVAAWEERGELKEAIAAIGKRSIDVSKIDAAIERAEQERYSNPVDRFALERRFAQAVSDSELLVVRREFRKAIDSITPFAALSIVGEEAKAKLKRIYRLKSEDAFERAQDAAAIGEFELARTILDALDDDWEGGPQSESQLKLIEKLNSEYALEQAVSAADRALDEDDFTQARELLDYLEDDPYVGERAREDLALIGEMEAIWELNAIALRTSNDASMASSGSLAIVPDEAPRLIRKVDPVYPDQLRRSRVKGFVDLVWTIGIDGEVTDVELVASSRKEFELPAIEALARWKFRPAEKEGVPVALRVRQKILFNPN